METSAFAALAGCFRLVLGLRVCFRLVLGFRICFRLVLGFRVCFRAAHQRLYSKALACAAQPGQVGKILHQAGTDNEATAMQLPGSHPALQALTDEISLFQGSCWRTDLEGPRLCIGTTWQQSQSCILTAFGWFHTAVFGSTLCQTVGV
jgi:hypothetical protein